MNRRELLVAAGTVTTAGLSGCFASGAGNEEPADGNGTTTVERRDERTIVVSNTGEATAEPDLAVIEAAVEATADAPATVRDDLADRSDALREALLDYGLPEDDVTTSDFRIRERIDRRQMEEDGVRPDSGEAAQEYVYYVGTHAFSVEVADIDEVGDVIDTAVDAGADSIDRVTFTLSEDRRADRREAALRRAIQGARSEAEVVADEVGTSIVAATVVDTSDGRVSPVHRDVSYAADAAMEMPAPDSVETGVEPGDVTVTADVRIQYRME